MRKNGNAIAIYSRKSKFTGKGESVGNQVEMCKEYIRMHYGDKAAETAQVFEDEGFSGGNLNRPDFKKMMTLVHQRKFQAIVVYRLDRISRNISDFSGLIEELADLDVAFVSIREQFDTGTPMGRAMMYIASVFSQLERETIAERIRDNMHELAKTGRWLGGTTPTGYVSESVETVTVDGKTKKAFKLKLVPEEAQIVASVYRVYTETESLAATEAELIRRGIKTKTGIYFNRFSIKSMLQNPVYMIADSDARDYFLREKADLYAQPEDFDGVRGIMAYNRTNQAKGKAGTANPVDEWVVSVGLHPGIIPGKTWVAIQSTIDNNKVRAYRQPKKNEALLTGVLYCRCGSRMFPRLTKGTADDGRPRFTYICRDKERSKGTLCDCPNCNGIVLDDTVMAELKKLQYDEDTFVTQMKQARSLYAGNKGDYETELVMAQEEKKASEKRMTALVDSLADAAVPAVRTTIMHRIEELSEEGERLDQRIVELESMISQEALNEEQFGLLEQMLKAFCAQEQEMTLAQRRSALKNVVRRVIWDGTRAHMVLFGGEGEIEYPDLSGLFEETSEDELPAAFHDTFDFDRVCLEETLKDTDFMGPSPNSGAEFE